MPNPLYDTLFAPHRGSTRPFLILSDGVDVSYDTFLRRAAQFAHAIGDCGLLPGDRLAVQIDKSPEALMIYAACAQTGVIFLPLNTGYTAAEVEYFVENSGAKLVLCSDASGVELAPIAAKSGARLEVLNSNGSGSFTDLAAIQPDVFATVGRDENDLAAFLYTSGTTGRSKGAMLSQKNLLSNARVLADYWQFTSDDVLLHALPVFHTHGLFVATNIALLTGGAMIFLPKFNTGDMIGLMPRATVMMGVPTFYTRLLGDPRFDADLTKAMRLFISGSAPLLADTHKEFEARTSHRILERYGMTETNMNTSNPYVGERRAGTVGFPLPGVELKICDDAGNELPTGEIGTLEVRGDNVFQGYWQMPEKTRKELRPNGFFITGDLGYKDKDGYVTIVGRGKDLIISGGFNIYPKELELLLDAQPGVLESAVIAAPHPDFGECPVAVLVAEQGKKTDLTKISAAIRQALAGFKQPKAYHVVKALPRNTMGKVQKNTLRDRYADSFTKK